MVEILRLLAYPFMVMADTVHLMTGYRWPTGTKVAFCGVWDACDILVRVVLLIGTGPLALLPVTGAITTPLDTALLILAIMFWGRTGWLYFVEDLIVAVGSAIPFFAPIVTLTDLLPMLLICAWRYSAMPEEEKHRLEQLYEQRSLEMKIGQKIAGVTAFIAVASLFSFFLNLVGGDWYPFWAIEKWIVGAGFLFLFTPIFRWAARTVNFGGFRRAAMTMCFQRRMRIASLIGAGFSVFFLGFYGLFGADHFREDVWPLETQVGTWSGFKNWTKSWKQVQAPPVVMDQIRELGLKGADAHKFAGHEVRAAAESYRNTRIIASLIGLLLSLAAFFIARRGMWFEIVRGSRPTRSTNGARFIAPVPPENELF